MGWLSNWKERRAAEKANLQAQFARSQEQMRRHAEDAMAQSQADHLNQLHALQSAHLTQIISTCGGIGDAHSAIAHKDYIIGCATALTSMRNVLNLSSHSEQADRLQAGYHATQALYLQKRLKQIELAIRPENFPEQLAGEQQHEKSLDDADAELQAYLDRTGLNINLGKSFSSQSRLSFVERTVQGVKDDCTRLSRNLDQFSVNLTRSIEVNIDPAIIAFILDDNARSTADPAPSGMA